ncbi:MAG: hypothetical protein WC119_04580 [Synergistaceae bacterium]
MNRKKKIDQFLSCAVISDIILFHGNKGLTQALFDEKWTYDSYPPSILSLKRLGYIRNKYLKWYIRHHINVEDKIWNGNFLAGLSTCGEVRWPPERFPSLRWSSNRVILEVLKDCPFHGNISQNSKSRNFEWHGVPALYLRSSEDSISFMAGVFATGQIKERHGAIYANYSKSNLQYLKAWGIPIEYQSRHSRYNLISPIWPALFTYYMPSSGKMWLNIDGAYEAELYATILWRMYVSNNIERLKIPYLKSRRWIYNNHGKIEETERRWLTMGLSQLDSRIKTVVKSMSKIV